MSKYEEQAYRVGVGKPNPNAKPNVPLLKSQLARLKHDLAQFIARKPDGSVIAPLKERIREMEATIASAEAENKRERQSARNPDDDEDGEIDLATMQRMLDILYKKPHDPEGYESLETDNQNQYRFRKDPPAKE